MDEKKFANLLNSIDFSLAELDLHTLDANLYMYNTNGKVYQDVSELTQDLVYGDVKIFIEIDALIGEKVWDNI
jgi:hypothetical protein